MALNIKRRNYSFIIGWLLLIIYIYPILLICLFYGITFYGIFLGIIGGTFLWKSPSFRIWFFRQPGYTRFLQNLPGLKSSSPAILGLSLFIYLTPWSLLTIELLRNVETSDISSFFLIGLPGVGLMAGWLILGWQWPIIRNHSTTSQMRKEQTLIDGHVASEKLSQSNAQYESIESVEDSKHLKMYKVPFIADDAIQKGHNIEAANSQQETNEMEVSLPQPDGVVYLLKAGPFYKIGKASNFNKRLKQIKLQLPYPVEVIHLIKSYDITGVETYWHRTFREKRANGEWFLLTDGDVNEFSKHSIM